MSKQKYEVMVDFGRQGFTEYGGIFMVLFYILKYSSKANVCVTKGVER